MSAEEEPARALACVARIQQFFSGWCFPAFFLFTLLLTQVFLLSILAIPPAPSGLGEFAASFKVWCYGYDPATGSLEWTYVVMVVANPLMLMGIVAAVWWQPLREVIRERPRRLLGPFVAAAALVSVCATGLLMQRPARPRGELPFPAEALRTSHVPPGFELTNQVGQRVKLQDTRGRVVLVTAVYARCANTCPMIFGQTKRAVAALSPEEQAELTVFGITLDPEHDDVETLALLAKGQEIAPPLFNLVTGPPPDVEQLLDRFGFARTRDPVTGVINHANLFVLIDRQGRIAYRLSLGDQQERWLTTALRLLIREGKTLAN